MEFTAVLEKSRFFLLVRGKDKKSCIDGYNRIKETKTDFEKLPGKWQSWSTLKIEVLFYYYYFIDPPK